MTLSEFLSAYGDPSKQAPRLYAHVEEWVRFRAPSGMKTAPAEEAQHRARHAQPGKDKHWWEISVGAYRSRRPARRDPVGEIHVLGVSEKNTKPLTFATKAEAQSVADQIKRGEISVIGLETGSPYLGMKRGAGRMARSTGRSVLLVSRMDDPYEGVRPGWYITNTESGVQVAGPFRTEASARQRLSSLEGHVGAAAKRGSLSKGETFAVGDRIKHRREFLRSIAWYTGVPRYGTVRAVTSLGKRALLEVDWSDGHTSKIISPNVTHASRVELV